MGGSRRSEAWLQFRQRHRFVKIVYEGQERSITIERGQALVLAANPANPRWKGPRIRYSAGPAAIAFGRRVSSGREKNCR